VPGERNTQESKGGRERDFVIEHDALLDEQGGYTCELPSGCVRVLYSNGDIGDGLNRDKI
jgi:hypothetical protein